MEILLEHWRSALLGGICLASTKKPDTIYATVRSPKHVEKLLAIYSEVEGVGKVNMDNNTMFYKHNMLPKLFFEKQTDADGEKVIVTGCILPLTGFLTNEELFAAEMDEDKAVIKVQDDLTMADIDEGLAGLCEEWGWTLRPGRSIPGQAESSRA